MLAATRFWLDLGIDGFRLDALNFSIPDKQLRNNPGKPRQEGMKTAQLDFLDPYAMQQHIYDKSQPGDAGLSATGPRITGRVSGHDGAG